MTRFGPFSASGFPPVCLHIANNVLSEKAHLIMQQVSRFWGSEVLRMHAEGDDKRWFDVAVLIAVSHFLESSKPS